jgi:hypothetical protein
MIENNDESPICEEDEQEKANKALDEIIQLLNKYKLRTQDLVVVYGNLGYTIGATIEAVDPNYGPSLEELQEKYYKEPTLGVALMLQGMLTTSWHDQVANGIDIQGLKEKENK